MSLAHAAAIFAAGIAAGTINTVVGSGTLITFPVLLGFGYPPVTANVSNTVGLVPGSVAGAIGYRRELTGQHSRMVPLAAASAIGGITGATLLLVLPASAFKAIVPAFIAIALVLIVVQPRLARALERSRGRTHRERAGPLATAAVFGSGIYGGYFGAAQGILLLAVLGLSLDDDLQRINALKVVLAGLVNLVAGVVFVFAAHIAWTAALLIAGGSTLGGLIGARAGRRLPPAALRAVIVVVGVVADRPADLIRSGGPDVIGPHLEVELVRAPGPGMVDRRLHQGAPSSPSARLGQDRHAERQDTAHALLGGGVADDAPVVFEHPQRRRPILLDHGPKPLSALLQVDGPLGTQEPLGRDLGDHLCHRGRVVDSGPPYDHSREGWQIQSPTPWRAMWAIRIPTPR